MTRRQFLITGLAVAPASLLFGCGKGNAEPSTPTTAAPSTPKTVAPPTPTIVVPPTPTIVVPPTPTIKPVSEFDTRLHRELVDLSRPASVGGQWVALQFNEFIDAMGEDSLKRTCKTLGVSPASVEQYASNTLMKREVKKYILSASQFTSFFGGDSDGILYHEQILRPTARKMELDATKIDTYDTLSLERAVYNRVFERSWTSLNENERIGFLEQSGWNLERDKVVSLAALTGAGILTGLAAVVSLSGFSFYMGMSSGLFALAGSMGLVLPFTVYTGASAAIALATGPVGWVAAAILATAGVYTWIASGKSTKEADLLKTVLHMHYYKIGAMQEANAPFSVTGM